MTSSLPGRARRAIHLLAHLGFRYRCPLCGYRARDLIAVGFDFPVLQRLRVVGAGRRAGGCPRCGSNERERLVFLYLRDELRIFDHPGSRILHLAPEPLLACRLVAAKFAEYIRGDKVVADYPFPPGAAQMEIEALPFPAAHFDLVICNHVLEHVADDRVAMRELRRVLKPDGQAILQVPIATALARTEEGAGIEDPREREQRFGQHDHVRLYGLDYPERLRAAGLLASPRNLGERYRREGINPEEDLFIVRPI